MSKEFKSFVFPETTKKQIDTMSSAEMKLRFYQYVTDYGMYGIEPTDLTDIETLIWIPMKDLLDNGKKSRGGAPANNQNARKTIKTTENNQNNVVLDETTKTTFNNDNGNHNVNLNDNDNGEGEEIITPPPSISEPQQNYAKLVFDKFRENNLPCQNGDFFKFTSFDFRLGLEKVRGINSKDVLQAIDNYIAELKNPESYIDKQFSFNAFVESKTFVNCLPSNYRAENFKKFMTREEKVKAEKEKATARENEFKNLISSHPKTCPDCNEVLVDVLGTGLAWMCPCCHSEWDLKNRNWVRKSEDVSMTSMQFFNTGG